VELYEAVGPALNAIRGLASVADIAESGAHRAEISLATPSADMRDARAALSRELAGIGLTVLSVGAAVPTLEDLFLAFTAPEGAKH
jgi:hypothetical protein